jgi:hypothetical protein
MGFVCEECGKDFKSSDALKGISTLTVELKLLANTVLSVSAPRHIIGDIVNENTRGSNNQFNM